MNRLIKYSVNHPVSILMYTLLLFTAGILSMFFISMDYLPKIKDRSILISTSYPGLIAEQMKDIVTIPVEDAFSSLKGTHEISSVTRDGISIIKITLQYNTDINMSLIEARQIIDQVSLLLPENCSKPEADIYSDSSANLLELNIIPTGCTLDQARYFSENDIKHFLQLIDGVGSTSVLGGFNEQIDVIIPRHNLYTRNLLLSDISNSILENNYEYPAGTISSGGNDYIIKTSSLFRSFDDFLKTPIQTKTGPLILSEIATIKKSHSLQKSFCYYNDSECIKLIINKKSKSNPIKTAKKIKSKIAELNETFPELDFIITNDTSTEIKNSIILVLFSAFLGSIITFFVLYFFLRKIKTSLLISSIIPLCILFSFTILFICNKTINLFSLSGISISIGMIVDSAIVTIENINKNLTRVQKISPEQVFTYTSQTTKSNLASMLTTIIVFLPFFLLPGLSGELFSDLSIAIISSIFISSILSLTYIPAISILFLPKELSLNFSNSILEKSTLIYKNFLAKNISNKKLCFRIIFFSVLLTIPAIIFLKKEIIQTSKENSVQVEFIQNPIYSIEKNKTDSLFIINQILNQTSIKQITLNGGIEDNDYQSLCDYKKTSSSILMTCTIKNKNQINELISILNKLPFQYTIKPKLDLISSTLGISKSFYIVSETKDSLNKLIKNIPVYFPSLTILETTFIPDLQKCNFYQIPKFEISNIIYNETQGVPSGTYLRNGNYIPIKAKLPETEINSIEQLRTSLIQIQDKKIPVNALGTFSTQTSEKILFRYNKKYAKEVEYFPDLIPPENIISVSKNEVSNLISSSILLLAVVFLLLYCTLGAQFESFYIPLLLLISIIPAFCGAFIFLFIFRQTLNINSLMSLVILFGTSVNNSIILFESFSAQKKFSLHSSIESFSQKLPAILITTITSIAALIPFTIDPLGINSQTSMSIAICGGLIFSLIQTLIFAPVLFTSIRRITN